MATKGRQTAGKDLRVDNLQKAFFLPHDERCTATTSTKKPLITQVCTPNEGRSLGDAMAYRKGVAATANKPADAIVSSAVFLPGLGLSTSWDYVAMVTGTPDDMATMMDTVR